MSLSKLVEEGEVYAIEEAVIEAVKNTEPIKITEELINGLKLAGEKFKSGEYFVVDMMQAAETFPAFDKRMGDLGLLAVKIAHPGGVELIDAVRPELLNFFFEVPVFKLPSRGDALADHIGHKRIDGAGSQGIVHGKMTGAGSEGFNGPEKCGVGPEIRKAPGGKAPAGAGSLICGHVFGYRDSASVLVDYF